MSVLALVPYPLGTTPSQRYRLEQWAPLLARDHGIDVDWAPFADERLAALCRARAPPGRRPGGWRRPRAAALGHLRGAADHDVLVVHRAAFWAGPAWLERAVSGRGRPVVFDFDDAI